MEQPAFQPSDETLGSHEESPESLGGTDMAESYWEG